jgi:hypothetical protein
MDPKIRNLKIKTGVVKRTGKEKLSYRVEADKQKEKIDKMKAEGKCEHDIKKMVEVGNHYYLLSCSDHHPCSGIGFVASANTWLETS